MGLHLAKKEGCCKEEDSPKQVSPHASHTASSVLIV